MQRLLKLKPSYLVLLWKNCETNDSFYCWIWEFGAISKPCKISSWTFNKEMLIYFLEFCLFEVLLEILNS